MTELLLMNVGVSLVVGTALLFVSVTEGKQDFARWFGASFVLHGLNPPAYLAWQGGIAPWSAVGFTTLVLVASINLALWIIGTAGLAGRPLDKRRVAAGVAGVLLIGTLTLLDSPRLAQAFHATLMTAVGLTALVWLNRVGRYESIACIAMTLIGLDQFVWVFQGDAGVGLQAGIGALLRVVLGLALLHAAMSRGRGETGRLRDQFRHLAERSHQGLAVMQGETMRYANPALRRIYGLPDDDDADTGPSDEWRERTVPAADRAIARERHRRILSGEITQDHWEGERYAFDGRKLRLRFSAWRVEWDGEPAEQVVVTDDTPHFDAIQTLLRQATHDELTGLPNRSALLQRLRELCAAGQPFALLLLDVDRFKLFNEAHGPSVGDEVLRALADGLTTQLRERAEVMRLGEDEFALLAPAADIARAERTARELSQGVRLLLQQPFALSRHRFFLDVSIGIALHPSSAATPETLLRAANAAMHEAKRTPGTSVQFAEERFERGSGLTLDAEQALRAGMKSDEFALVYQPKVDAATRALVGFEALARWDRPGIGRIGPNEFVPAAERTGLIGPLGNLILTLACHQIAEWRESFGSMVPVAVNVSPLQLLDPGFPDLVVSTLRHFDIPPELLTLEITETAAVTHMDQARGQIAQMRAHGIEVALDDFGTGFSSLNMLRSLPLSTVKIDRTLIDPMPAADATAVVKAICDLAAALRIEVVAEGVETAEHASSALAAGCQVLQGYLYAMPLEPAEAAGWMQARAALKS